MEQLQLITYCANRCRIYLMLTINGHDNISYIWENHLNSQQYVVPSTMDLDGTRKGDFIVIVSICLYYKSSHFINYAKECTIVLLMLLVSAKCC